ncbi:MAG TPA: hypothetical protein VF384_16640 [Planctomycetota bacterium]
MPDPLDRCSRILVLVLRVAAVTFALAVLGWLVVQAQRNANGGAEPQAPEVDSPERRRLLSDPIVGPVEPIVITADDETYLFSSKAARIEPVHEAARTQTYLHSSKTITPLPMPVVPKLVFPPPSQSGKPAAQPGPQNQRN